MKRLTVDLEPIAIPRTEIAKKITQTPIKEVKKINLKRIKVKLLNKNINPIRCIRREHNYYVIQKLNKSEKIVPNKNSSKSTSNLLSNQLSIIPTNAKVNVRGLTGNKQRASVKRCRNGDINSSGALNSFLIECNNELFQKTVKDIIEQVQNAKSRKGTNILRKLMEILGEQLVMQEFIPIRERAEQGIYTNFMLVSMDMNQLFLQLEKRLEAQGLSSMTGIVVELETVFNSGVVNCLSLDSVLESVLYPLYTRRAQLELITTHKMKNKHRQEYLAKLLIDRSQGVTPDIVILSDEENIQSENVSTSIIINTPPVPQPIPKKPENIPIAVSSADPIQIRSDESESGYLQPLAKKTKTSKQRGEFENYVQFLVDEHLDKHTAITSQNKDRLEMVIKLVNMKYPEQQHEVRKRIRSVLRNKRRTNNRQMLKSLEEFGNSGSFPTPTPSRSTVTCFKNLENQPISAFTPFSQQTPQLEKSSHQYPSYNSTPIQLQLPEGIGLQNRYPPPGVRFKIPYHLEVLHPAPQVMSIYGDRANQFALYNYITSQKDSDGKNLCSHFLDYGLTNDNQMFDDSNRKPLDLKTIAYNISKMSRYSSLRELVKDFELMLDNAIKKHQLRSFIGRDALRLKQLITSRTRDLQRKEDIVDLTQTTTQIELFNNKHKSKQLMNFYQDLENYRDSNSRLLLFSFLLPPTGLKYPLDKKKFPTLLEIKTNLKKNLYLGLNSLAHSILYTIYAYLSVYHHSSQAFRDSEEMAKYVHTLYKQYTGEVMVIARYAPKLYNLPDRNGHFTLALPTADFLGLSYQTMHQSFTTLLASEKDMRALYLQAVGKRSVPIAYLIPYNEVEELIKQNVQYPDLTDNNDANTQVSRSLRTKLTSPTSSLPLSPMGISPIPVTQSITKPTSSTTQPIAVQTNTFPTEYSVFKITHTDKEMNLGSRLRCYNFPSLQFNKYVIKHELLQHLVWNKDMFECLFHSVEKKVPMKREKLHLRKAYNIVDDPKCPIILISYEDVSELLFLGDKFKEKDLIIQILGQRRLLKGLKRGSVPGVNLLQFQDNKNNTYFVTRELMNRMDVSLQDLVVLMELSVALLDPELGLCGVGEWDDIVRAVQKDPRYFESMVCLYTDNLKLVLSELEVCASYGCTRGKIIVDRFIKMKSKSEREIQVEPMEAVPITISSEDEDVSANGSTQQKGKEYSISVVKNDEYTPLSELVNYLKWNEEEIKRVFETVSIIDKVSGTKYVPFSYVNKVISELQLRKKDKITTQPQAIEDSSTPDNEPAKLWTLPNKKEGHIILEDLGRYANIPIEVLEVTYQIYIYVVKTDTDKKSLSLQGFDFSNYGDQEPIRMVEHSKVKWILDMKAKKQNINFNLCRKGKKIEVPLVPKKATRSGINVGGVELKDFSINIAKEKVDPLKIFKYNMQQILTLNFKIVTVLNNKKNYIKLKIVELESIQQPVKWMRIYTVSDMEVVTLYDLGEFTHIPSNNLFLILLSYGLTYYSNKSKTKQLQMEFAQYAMELSLQGVNNSKNVTIYPLEQVALLVQLRRIGFLNIKLIGLYNLINATSQSILNIIPTANLFKKVRNKKSIYSIDYRVHTVKDTESGKTVILKIYDDHYLFKPRDPIKVYTICEGNKCVRVILLHDMARYTNVPLTRLQCILSSYSTVLSYSNASVDPEAKATFKRYIKLLLAFGVPPYLKHTVLYPIEHLTTFLHLRELGFFNEKLLDVFKMIKLSPVVQKRILLTIKPSSDEETRPKRSIEAVSDTKQMPAKIPRLSPIAVPEESNEPKEIPRLEITNVVSELQDSLTKLDDVIKTPNIYKLSSMPGRWILQNELKIFLGYDFSLLYDKLKPFELQIDSEFDVLEMLEQGAKLSRVKLFLIPMYVVENIIEAKIQGMSKCDIKKMFSSLQDTHATNRYKTVQKFSNCVPSVISNLLGVHYPDPEIDLSPDYGKCDFDQFKIRTVWINKKSIKLKIPFNPDQECFPSLSLLESISIPNSNSTCYHADELAEFLRVDSHELIIAFKGGRIKQFERFLLEATPHLKLFISLRLIGIPIHRIWLTYFACIKITSSRFGNIIRTDTNRNFSTNFFRIGKVKTKLLLPKKIKKKRLPQVHISTVYIVPECEEFYYIAEEVAVEMKISFAKLLETDMLFFRRIKNLTGRSFKLTRSSSQHQQSHPMSDYIELPYTLVRVDDLQQLSLLHNLDIPGPLALEIFQRLRLVQDGNCKEVFNYTDLCKNGYKQEELREWMFITKREGRILQSISDNLKISSSVLKKKHKHSSHIFYKNSIEHIFLKAQGAQLPEEFDYLTFLISSQQLDKDLVYLNKLKSNQKTILSSHEPAEWPRILYPNLITHKHSELEFFTKTAFVDGRKVRILSRQKQTFTNLIKIHVLTNKNKVVLLSDVAKAFVPLTWGQVDRLCESLKVKRRQATFSEIKYLCLQRGDLSGREIADMNILCYDGPIKLAMLLIGMGANPTQLMKRLNEINWSTFPNSIDVLVSSPLEFNRGITDYLTYRSNNDPQFFDLSQDYNYHIVDKTRPTLTITRNIRDNNQLAPFCVWRLDFTHSNWVLVSALKELYGECVKNYFSLRDERTVIPESEESRVLASQGFVFPAGQPQGFWIADDFDCDIWKKCFSRLSELLYQPLLAKPSDDITVTTITAEAICLKIVTLTKYHRSISLKKYAQYSRYQSTRFWTPVEDVLSFVPELSSKVTVGKYFNEIKQTRIFNRVTGDKKPITFVRWLHAIQLIQLLELGCDVDNAKMLELHNYIMKQTDKVIYKISSLVSCSVWCFLNDVS